MQALATLQLLAFIIVFTTGILYAHNKIMPKKLEFIFNPIVIGIVSAIIGFQLIDSYMRYYL